MFPVLALCFLVIVSCIVLAGCKNSDVLNELINDQEIGELDETREPIYEENPDAPEDPSRISKYESQNDNVAEQENTQATFDENPNTENTQTEQREQAQTNHDYKATQGTQNDGSKGRTPEISSNDTAGGGGGDDSSQEVPGGKGGGTKIFNADDAATPLPENVHSVAAAGSYGVLVEMLCGQGALVGTDAAAQQMVSSSGAFPGEGFESIGVCWDGDGNPILSEIKAQSPRCILQSTSTRTLTQEEMDALSDAGVECDILVMPEIDGPTTTDADLMSAVTTVGELLHPAAGNTSTYDSKQSASEFVELHDQVINACVSANGGYSYKVINGSQFDYIYQGEAGVGTATTRLSGNRYTTVFVDSWTSALTSTVNSARSYSGASVGYLSDPSDVLDVSGGVGLSLSGQNSGFLLMDYYLQCAGVVDNSFEGDAPVAASSATRKALPSVISAGSDTGLALNTQLAGRSAPSALWFSSSGGWSNDTTLIGDAKFPGMFVRTSEIADKVSASASLTNGFYNIGQSFSLYVMPSGMFGSWADGGLESYLLSAYALGYYVGNESLQQTFSNAAATHMAKFYRSTGVISLS